MMLITRQSPLCIRLRDVPVRYFAISWRSSLQKIVTLSTAEAEYVALAAVVQEVWHMKQVLLELGFAQTGPVRIGEDDQATIRISKNPEHHGRCKHIDIRYFFVQERQQSG